VSDEQILPGTDVQLIGIPKHEVWNAGKEMRVLKGHVTLSGKYLELNIPVPAGMSGSPIFVGRKVVGYATGVVRTEELEDYVEEEHVVSNTLERISVTKVNRVTHYGLACHFFGLRGQTSPVFDNETLVSLIAKRNSLP
jgi:hypothetical protein